MNEEGGERGQDTSVPWGREGGRESGDKGEEGSPEMGEEEEEDDEEGRDEEGVRDEARRWMAAAFVTSSWDVVHGRRMVSEASTPFGRAQGESESPGSEPVE